MWFLLVLSVLMLVMGLTNLDTAKPFVMVFWLLMGGIASYMLFFKSSSKAL